MAQLGQPHEQHTPPGDVVIQFGVGDPVGRPFPGIGNNFAAMMIVARHRGVMGRSMVLSPMLSIQRHNADCEERETDDEHNNRRVPDLHPSQDRPILYQLKRPIQGAGWAFFSS